MNKPQIKDMIWHGGKTLLCAIQFWILFLLVRTDFSTFLEPNQEEFSLFGVLTYFFFPAVVVALFVALWRYYDTVDDRSFNKVRKAAEPPHFLHDPACFFFLSVEPASGGNGRRFVDKNLYYAPGQCVWLYQK